MLDGVPLEGSLGYALGRELGELIALESAADSVLQRRYVLLQEMLSSDPLSVFQVVGLPTGGTDGLVCSIFVRDDLGSRLALAADDLELSHMGTPAVTGDSAA